MILHTVGQQIGNDEALDITPPIYVWARNTVGSANIGAFGTLYCHSTGVLGFITEDFPEKNTDTPADANSVDNSLKGVINVPTGKFGKIVDAKVFDPLGNIGVGDIVKVQIAGEMTVDSILDGDNADNATTASTGDLIVKLNNNISGSVFASNSVTVKAFSTTGIHEDGQPIPNNLGTVVDFANKKIVLF